MSHGGSPSAPTPLPSPRVIPAYAGNAPSCATRARGSPVHPPMRGERLPCPDQAWPHLGSSPHARGTLLGKNPQRAIERFIPACAGNAPWVRTSGWPRTVHPRMRGERRVSAESIMASIGSSPHTRGTLGGKLDALRHVRFIPAYAGNALALHAGTSSPAVHPRIRGERSAGFSPGFAPGGSSPHTRGTPYSIRVMPRVHRFIPAYAGNAHARERIAVSYTVHPRIRGERKLKSKDKEGTDGSSPHTRGTRRPKTPTVYRQRFIPAYAGNASLERCHDGPLPVHPRIRGERTFLKFCRMADGGSSPHTRGTRREPERMEPVGRFIPAYAGNARVRTEPASSSPVHPRIRGERYPLPSTKRLKFGSSPHTRGTRRWPGPCARRCRFIPAYAGNAGSHRWRPNEDAVHPRIRGERPNSPALAISCIGSSPHTRGTRIMQSERFASKSVHPRIRGERFFGRRRCFLFGGSSPHTRGTLW